MTENTREITAVSRAAIEGAGKAPEKALCGICGEPMPEGEQMFKFHGYSGPCPKPPLAKQTTATQFENALADLVERYLRDGLAPTEINAVLHARADDDYAEFARSLLAAEREE